MDLSELYGPKEERSAPAERPYSLTIQFRHNLDTCLDIHTASNFSYPLKASAKAISVNACP